MNVEDLGQQEVLKKGVLASCRVNTDNLLVGFVSDIALLFDIFAQLFLDLLHFDLGWNVSVNFCLHVM